MVLLGPVSLQGQERLLVLNKAEGTMSVIDPWAGKTVGTIPVGTGPHEVAVSADGRTAWVTNYGTQAPGRSLSQVDLASLRETRRIELDSLPRPHGIALVGDLVWFTAEGAQAVAAWDPAAGRVVRVIPTGQQATHMLVPSPGGRRLYTANIRSNSVSALDLEDGTVRHFAAGPEPEGIDISPDGGELWVGRNGDGRVSVLDAETGELRATLSVGGVPIRVKFTPSGDRVLVSDAQGGRVVVFEARTRTQVAAIEVGSAVVGLLVEPSGRRAYAAAPGVDRVYVLDIEQGTVVGTLPTGSGPDGLGWAESLTRR
jgi:YVTN family beta-propeller protein